jgi:hypothetical protein
MERVAFLIEETNERIGCLLNPESVVVRRLAGVQRRRGLSGHITGRALSDDPLLFTGGGQTELDLDLLFDVSLAGSTVSSEDVRDLTGPLWDLAENSQGDEDGRRRPPLVRFVWGKSWNVPGVVVAVAERLEDFSGGGVPRRSWLRMRFRRMAEPHPSAASAGAVAGTVGAGAVTDGLAETTPELLEEIQRAAEAAPERLESHEVIGAPQEGEEPEPLAGERVDQIAFRYFGDANLWRVLAEFNDLVDPLRLPAGLLLRIPWLPFGGKE